MNALTQWLAGEQGAVRHSGWQLVDQRMIDGFAEVTLDRQYIHVDPVRAAASPFGGTIAHGFLTLSLLSHMQEELYAAIEPEVGMTINYGAERLRFINPVRSGSRIRLASTLVNFAKRAAGGFRITHDYVVEIEGQEKPALMATWVLLVADRTVQA